MAIKSYKKDNGDKAYKYTGNLYGTDYRDSIVNLSYADAKALELSDYYTNMSQASAQKQMDFQEYMSNTSHQREVSDLISAGLNPVLSANNGASVTSGSSASADSTGSQLLNARKIQKMNNETALKQTQLSNEMNWKINQASLKAQKEMNKYNADLNYAASIYGADSSASASAYAAQQAYASSVYSADTSKYINDNPNTLVGYAIKTITGSSSASSFIQDKMSSFSKYYNMYKGKVSDKKALEMALNKTFS